MHLTLRRWQILSTWHALPLGHGFIGNISLLNQIGLTPLAGWVGLIPGILLIVSLYFKYLFRLSCGNSLSQQ